MPSLTELLPAIPTKVPNWSIDLYEASTKRGAKIRRLVLRNNFGRREGYADLIELKPSVQLLGWVYVEPHLQRYDVGSTILQTVNQQLLLRNSVGIVDSAWNTQPECEEERFLTKNGWEDIGDGNGFVFNQQASPLSQNQLKEVISNMRDALTDYASDARLWERKQQGTTSLAPGSIRTIFPPLESVVA